MPVSISGTNGVTFPDNSLQAAAASPFGLKNRIINGAMVIDQRNAGASVTPTASSYTLDRWLASLNVASKFSIQQNAGSVTPPVGFTNYLGVTSTSAYAVTGTDAFSIQHRIEGFNTADLSFGTANARTITLSFWVRSSLTGTFGGQLYGNPTRSYPFTYSITSANTWTYVSITISGDTTTNTYNTTNNFSLIVVFGLGSGSSAAGGTINTWQDGNFTQPSSTVSVVGTNGATWYITGVQLEIGTSATPFERRMYGQELALCQRYYYKITAPNSPSVFGESANADSATLGEAKGHFPVTMRTYPTALEQSGTASHYIIRTGGVDRTCSAVPTYNSLTNYDTWRIITTVASGQTAGLSGALYSNSSSAYLAWSAEL